MARPTRVVYVENDPALRGIMSSLLGARSELEVILAAGSGADALRAHDQVAVADVALLDLALGRGEVNGIDLGLQLREVNPDLGIVIHSQHDAAGFEGRIPARHRAGWVTFPKSGDLDIEALVVALKSAARGIAQQQQHDPVVAEDPLARMTLRQREIMRLLALGLSTQEIARQLETSQAAVRQELSRAYRCLVPDLDPAEDLRTKALLRFLELTQPDAADSL